MLYVGACPVAFACTLFLCDMTMLCIDCVSGNVMKCIGCYDNITCYECDERCHAYT